MSTKNAIFIYKGGPRLWDRDSVGITNSGAEEWHQQSFKLTGNLQVATVMILILMIMIIMLTMIIIILPNMIVIILMVIIIDINFTICSDDETVDVAGSEEEETDSEREPSAEATNNFLSFLNLVIFLII